MASIQGGDDDRMSWSLASIREISFESTTNAGEIECDRGDLDVVGQEDDVRSQSIGSSMINCEVIHAPQFEVRSKVGCIHRASVVVESKSH